MLLIENVLHWPALHNVTHDREDIISLLLPKEHESTAEDWQQTNSSEEFQPLNEKVTQNKLNVLRTSHKKPQEQNNMQKARDSRLQYWDSAP